jgi:4-amino-4-deoxy-L-arabinose transferase-like glycosyltransferase
MTPRSAIQHMCDALSGLIRLHPFITLCLVGVFVSFVGISNQLWTPDEPRDAAIGQAMWTSGSWVTPRLNGEPFLEKPPFYWWAQSTVFAAFERATPTLARMPSAMFGFATLLLTYALGRRFFSSTTSLLAGLILLSTALFVIITHWIVVDNALVFAITGAWAAFAHAENRAHTNRMWLLLAMYVFLVVAFLTKGVVGLGIFTVGAGAYLLWSRRVRSFFGWHILLGGLLIAGAVALWLWMLWREGGREPVETFIVYNQLGRFFPKSVNYHGGHVRPWWYYFVNAPADLLPWTPFLIIAMSFAWRHRERFSQEYRDGIRLCISGTFPVMLALTLSGTKRELYLLPVYPLFALLIAAGASADGERLVWEEKLERWWELILLGCTALAPVAIFLAPNRWLFSIPAVALMYAFWYWSKSHATQTRETRLLRTAVMLCLAAAVLLITVKPFVDKYKSFTPFVYELEKQVPATVQLYAYRPDETTLGVVGFYTGRRIKEVELDELKTVAAINTTSWLIVRDSKPRGGNYGDIVTAGIPHRLVSEQVVGDSRTMRILAVGKGGRIP